MGGRISLTDNKEAASIALCGLLKIKYRGCDSVDLIGTINSDLHLKKDTGRIEEIDRKHKLCEPSGKLAIAQTGWATHNSINKVDTRPHLDCTKRISAAGNRIAENLRCNCIQEFA